MSSEVAALRAIAERALEWVPRRAVVGLGTGRAATAFLQALGASIQAGTHEVLGVPTSLACAETASRLGIPLTTLDEHASLDVDIDGADEVDPRGNVLKGYGGALVREKIVATAAKKLLILVSDEKLVPVLGSRGKLPVEVIPFGLSVCQRALAALGCQPNLRRDAEGPHVTDNGNYLLDCQIKPLADPAAFETALLAIPGVVGTGLFLNMRPIVLIQRADGVEVRETGSTCETGS